VARILAYPLARRRGLIRKQGARLASLPNPEAEKHLAYLLKQQGDALRRRGLDADEAARQVACLEAAVRVEIARNLMSYRGQREPENAQGRDRWRLRGPLARGATLAGMEGAAGRGAAHPSEA